ncbi:MAG: MaoC family dehydratase [Hyphomicrobiales bacterium]
MREFANLAELAAAKGSEIGVSPWLVVDQARIDKFAEATDDFQWIHVDPDRTRKELGMPTIAHGYLTLSLIPRFLSEVYKVSSVIRALNYGSNKVRYTNMVPAGARIRGRVFLQRATLEVGSIRTISNIAIEIENEEKPALVAEIISMMFE